MTRGQYIWAVISHYLGLLAWLVAGLTFAWILLLVTACVLSVVPAPTADAHEIAPSAKAAFGIETMIRLDSKTDERQYAFTRRCHRFEALGVRYVNVRSRGVRCARVRRMIRRRVPRAFVCGYFPLRPGYRFTCNRSPEGTSFAFTTHTAGGLS